MKPARAYVQQHGRRQRVVHIRAVRPGVNEAAARRSDGGGEAFHVAVGSGELHFLHGGLVEAGELHLGADRVVQLQRRKIAARFAQPRGLEVVAQLAAIMIRSGGQRHQRDHLHGDGVEAGHWNRVVHKRIARGDAVDCALAQLVENHARLRDAPQRVQIIGSVDLHVQRTCGVTVAGDDLAEVTGAVSGVGYRGIGRVHFGVFVELFERAEEERLVLAVVKFRNPHRTADGEAVAMAFGGVAQSSVGRVRIENLVGRIVVRAAVEAVGAGLQRCVEDCAAHGTELGGVGGRLHGDFLNGFGAGLAHGGILPQVADGVGGLAFQAELHRVIRRAVDHDASVTDELHAGEQVGEPVGVAIAGGVVVARAARREQRQLVELRDGDVAGHRRGLRAQHGGFRGNCH